MGSNMKINIEVPFESNRIAEIVYHVLRVDAEPKRSGVKKELTLRENYLDTLFTGELESKLRVAVNSFFENIKLIIETIEVTGPPISDKYSYF